jgi:trehalose 6-phosphate synthase/phosphatase
MTSSKWAENVLLDLKNIQHPKDHHCVPCTTLGLGSNYRITHSLCGSSNLDVSKLSKAYRLSNQRLIILDWGGTLVDSIENFEAYALATRTQCSDRQMTAELKDILSTLAHDTRNHIFVISRRDMNAMLDHFGSVNGLGLAAEHGCYYIYPKSTLREPQTMEWQTLISVDDRTWMETVRNIMAMYTQRTHGSYIEEKNSAMVWQFGDTDPEFGLFQSQELEEHLSDILSDHPLEVTRGNGYLEIRPAGLNKGLFLQHMLSFLHIHNIHIDFLLTMGNDVTDEEMFEITNRTQMPMSKPFRNPHCYSVAVGKRVTSAKYYLNSPEDVREVLHSLLRISKLGREYLSAHDLFAESRKDERELQKMNYSQKRSHSISHSSLFTLGMTPKPTRNLEFTPIALSIASGDDLR